jgi:hypothetical protein
LSRDTAIGTIQEGLPNTFLEEFDRWHNPRFWAAFTIRVSGSEPRFESADTEIQGAGSPTRLCKNRRRRVKVCKISHSRVSQKGKKHVEILLNDFTLRSIL